MSKKLAKFASNSNASPVPSAPRKPIRCAIYTRKSTEEGLEQDFNTLDAQRDSAQSFIASQRTEGWILVPTHYDDGGFTGADMDRPALQQLLADVRSGMIHCVVVYKVDRLTRSLLDFSRIIDVLDRHNATFVSVTQQFNTTSSLGRLTLNILLSFAQFERETISERTRDKMSAARRRGKWTGGHLVLGYDLLPGAGGLVINPAEAERVRDIFQLYRKLGSLLPTVRELRRRDWRMKQWINRAGDTVGGGPFTRATLHGMLTNPVYAGQIRHRGKLFAGEHEAVLEPKMWQQVQQHLARRGSKGVYQANRFGALLIALAHCATCDARMTHTWSRRKQTVYRYYTCLHSIQHGAASSHTRSVSAPALELAVVQQLQQLAETDSGLQLFLTWEQLAATERVKVIAQFVKRVSFDGRSLLITLTLHRTNDTDHAA